MTETTIDTRVLQELEDTTGADFVAELVETFLADAPGMIADLKTAAKTSDPDGFRRAAHSIKSNANVFGAPALAEAARRLELADLAANGPEITAGLDRLEQEYKRAAAALKAYPDA